MKSNEMMIDLKINGDNKFQFNFDAIAFVYLFVCLILFFYFLFSKTQTEIWSDAVEWKRSLILMALISVKWSLKADIN